MEDSLKREKKHTFNPWNDAQILTHVTSNVDRASDFVRMKIFNAPAMSSRTYNRNPADIGGENYYNAADRVSFDYLKTGNTIPSYTVNTMHLQNPYRPLQSLEGFASRDHTKGMYRSQDFTLRSRYNNLSVKRESNKTNDQMNEKAERPKNGKKHQGLTEISELAKQYCSYSTLHGLRYVGDTGLSIVERIFWIISFTIALTVAIYYICYLYQKWSLSPIIISLSPDPISLNEFPFPSVTICNMNKVKKTEAKRIERGFDDVDKLIMGDMCDIESNITYDHEQETIDWDRMLRFMINVSQPCTDMLYYCLWHGNQTDCERIFNPTMTDEGICCNFNSVTKKHLFYNAREWPDLNITYPSESVDWNAEKGYDASMPADVIPWRPYGAGLIYGLTLALDVDMDEYYCSSTAGAGFKMLLHNPVETPKIADFSFAITPGEESRVIVRPRISSANPSIISIPLKKRKCFFTKERKLRYYRTYTQRNCILECEANFTQQLCDCVQYYMPKSSHTPICGKKDEQCAKQARRAMEIKLYDEDVTNTLNITKIPSCNCWPGCFEINYRIELSQSKLIPTFQSDKRYVKGDMNYFTENMAVVHLFFVDSQFTKYVKNELFGFIEFLCKYLIFRVVSIIEKKEKETQFTASTGGLLGLFMGFSFLSFMEILYFSTMRLWCRLHNHRELRRPPLQTHPLDNKKMIYPFMN